MAKVHVIGAGVAGLACAVRLVRAGLPVVLYEAASHAGGRCRSFDDEVLGARIDNGNHLLLSGNRAALDYLAESGASDGLIGPARAVFPFVELPSERRWTIRPNGGRLPWWVFAAARRAPGTRAWDYLRGLNLGWASPDATVARCLDDGGAAFARFWEPLAVAVLNTAAHEAAARLLWPVLVEIFGRGEAAARPRLAREGLSQTFVEPALRTIEAGGGELRFNHRLRRIETDAALATGLDFATGRIALAADEGVVVALPPWIAGEVLAGITAPGASRPIVNAHFRLAAAPAPPEGVPLLGIVGGTAQWVFFRRDIVSVTVSAAADLADAPAEAIEARVWDDLCRALGLAATPRPPCRVVKERRATFAQIPAELPRRPETRTSWRNLALAGDWTDTGLPATIEGAVRSGHRAAAAIAKSLMWTGKQGSGERPA